MVNLLVKRNDKINSIVNMSKETFLATNNITPKHIARVHGGDINQAWRIDASNDATYFLKENNATDYPGMMKLEAEGLLALSEGSDLHIPGVIATGEEDGQQFLLLQWLEKTEAPKNFWQDFGSNLASMHRKPQPYFGWEKDNYIGSLVQQNSAKYSWTDFYCQCRIMPLADKLYQQSKFTKYDLAAVQKLCMKIHLLFPPEPASLLHGDLWSGNYLCAGDGRAAIYDPAVYYGHREMDLSMTRLFGGFDSTFYQAYQETYPLETGWQDRIQLAQLYPMLVHAVLFGGHYLQQAIGIIKQYS